MLKHQGKLCETFESFAQNKDIGIQPLTLVSPPGFEMIQYNSIFHGCSSGSCGFGVACSFNKILVLKALFLTHYVFL